MEPSGKRKFNGEGDSNSPTGSPSPKKKVIGPSLPPLASSEQPNPQSDSGSDSESDDDFGPSLPPPHGQPAPTPAQQPADNQLTQPKAHEKKEGQRDQWMLHPPEQSEWASKIDPTQIRSRKFQTGRSAGSATSKEVDASWMETPQERMRRLGDEVLGVSSPSGTTKTPASSSRANAARAKSMEDKIKKFHDRTGKNPHLETPADARKEDDDPSARAFDREKDMAVSSRISHAQRREMMNKASGYSSRFTKGDFL